MALVTAGTDETINANYIEGKLFQLAHLINNAEKGLDSQKLTINKTDDSVLEGDFTIPGVVTYNPLTGLFTVTAAPYLPAIPFTPGSPTGTIKGATLSQYFIDVVNYIIHWQNQTDKNISSLTNCTMSFNYNSLQYVGRIILPYTSVLGQNGQVIESATEWLKT